MGRTGKGGDKVVSNERKNWENLLRVCIETIQNQNRSIESLDKDKKFVEDRFKTRDDRWAYYARFLEGLIFKMQSDITVERLARAVDTGKSDYTLGSTEREALMYKLKLDHAAEEIENAMMLMDVLKEKCSDPNDSMTDDEHRARTLEKEVTRLKQEIKKLSLQKDAEVASLLLEKDFVWNQFKTMENDFGNKLKTKHEEAEQAKAKIEMLLSGMDKLQVSNDEKDATIVNLKTSLAEMKAADEKKKSEILRLGQELDLLKKSKGGLVTPLLSRCTMKPAVPDARENTVRKSSLAVKKESSTSRGVAVKASGSSRRKRDDVIVIDDSPKLFTSTFKVPKLKRNSSRKVIPIC